MRFSSFFVTFTNFLSFIQLLSEAEGRDEPEFFTNQDLTNIVTPPNMDLFVNLLENSGYPESEITFLEDGFRNSFSLEYQGLQNRQSVSENIPFTVGNKTQLWGKLMKEVKLKRVAGPFDRVPFDNFIQSPIGLVPKAGDDQT